MVYENGKGEVSIDEARCPHFKTGIAVALALFLAALFHFPSPVFAGISAVFAMQPTIYRSYLSLIEQVQANVIGALFAIAAVLILGRDPLVVGLTLMIVIALCLKSVLNRRQFPWRLSPSLPLWNTRIANLSNLRPSAF